MEELPASCEVSAPSRERLAPCVHPHLTTPHLIVLRSGRSEESAETAVKSSQVKSSQVKSSQVTGFLSKFLFLT